MLEAKEEPEVALAVAFAVAAMMPPLLLVIVSTAQFVLADRWSALAQFIVAGFMLLPAFLGALLGHWAGTRAHLRKARA